MPVIVSQKVAAGYAPVPQTTDEIKCVRSIIALPTTALILNDVLDTVILPADCVPVDFEADFDDLDSNGTPTLGLDAGIITGRPGDTTQSNRTVGTEFLSADTTARSGGVVRTARQAAFRVAAMPVDRSIGFRVQAAPATAVVQTGTLSVNRGQWAPNTAYAVSDFLVLPNGAIMRCTTAGTSSTYGQTETRAPTQNQPAWNLGFGLTTTDGGATWTCVSPIIGVTLQYRMGRDKL